MMALVLQSKRGQFVRQGEDCMNIAGGQQFPLPRLEPAHACVALASWAMPIPARVVGDFSRLSAAGAAIAMPTERGGAAALDRQQHFRCCQLIHLRLRSTNACPAQRTMSAISSRGRLMSCACVLPVRDVSASSGLAVALRCRWDRCR